MDKLSEETLRYINKQDNTSRQDIIESFGVAAKKSIDYLLNEDYISAPSNFMGMGVNGSPVFSKAGKYSITSKGVEYLEEKTGKIFDKWLTRILAIWGAITGTIAIVVEIVQVFQ